MLDGHPCHLVLMVDGGLRGYRECAGQGQRVNQQIPEQRLPPRPPEAICEPTFFKGKTGWWESRKGPATTIPRVDDIHAFLPQPVPKSPVLFQVSLRKNQPLRATLFTLCRTSDDIPTFSGAFTDTILFASFMAPNIILITCLFTYLSFSQQRKPDMILPILQERSLSLRELEWFCQSHRAKWLVEARMQPQTSGTEILNHLCHQRISVCLPSANPIPPG